MQSLGTLRFERDVSETFLEYLRNTNATSNTQHGTSAPVEQWQMPRNLDITSSPMLWLDIVSAWLTHTEGLSR